MGRPNMNHDCEFIKKEDGTMLFRMTTTYDVPQNLIPKLDDEYKGFIARFCARLFDNALEQSLAEIEGTE